MKYTIDDIKALVNVQKTIIEQDKDKQEIAFQDAFRKVKQVDFRDLYDTLLEFNQHIDFDFGDNTPHIITLEGKNNCFKIAHWCNASELNISFGFEKFISFPRYEHLFNYKKTKEKEWICEDETYNFTRKKVALTDLFNCIVENEEMIRNYYEKTIESNYQKQLNKIVDLANKEY